MRRMAIYHNDRARRFLGGEMLSDFDYISRLLRPLLADTEFVEIDSANGQFPADPTAFDGVILGGSNANVTEDEPWMKQLFKDIRTLDVAKRPLFGICFGHQAIARALGGRVDFREVSIGAPHLELLKPENWMHPYLPSLRLYAGNFQQVVEVPKSMRVIAIGRNNKNAMLAKDDHIISVQFHPEYSHSYMAALAEEYHDHKLIDLSAYQQAKKEIHGETHGQIMGKWIAKFFLGHWQSSAARQPELHVVKAG